MTFLFFPLCVVQAWVADRRLLFYKYVRKRYRADKNRGIIIETEGGPDGGIGGMDGGGGALGPGGFTKMDMLELDGQMALNCHSGMDGGMMEEGGAKDEEDEARRDMARTLKELKQRHPDKDMEQLIEMANYQVCIIYHYLSHDSMNVIFLCVHALLARKLNMLEKMFTKYS